MNLILKITNYLLASFKITILNVLLDYFFNLSSCIDQLIWFQTCFVHKILDIFIRLNDFIKIKKINDTE